MQISISPRKTACVSVVLNDERLLSSSPKIRPIWPFNLHGGEWALIRAAMSDESSDIPVPGQLHIRLRVRRKLARLTGWKKGV
jgi:hypothetical protein